MNNFKRLCVRAKLLNGKERLHLMHDMFHMGDHDRFNFDWKWLPESGLSVLLVLTRTQFRLSVTILTSIARHTSLTTLRNLVVSPALTCVSAGTYIKLKPGYRLDCLAADSEWADWTTISDTLYYDSWSMYGNRTVTVKVISEVFEENGERYTYNGNYHEAGYKLIEVDLNMQIFLYKNDFYICHIIGGINKLIYPRIQDCLQFKFLEKGEESYENKKNCCVPAGIHDGAGIWYRG